ncbi:MAG: tetratricopeptide repeat protein [Kiritimatiellae bacterium]|nr:tetratricopeptide repeat protein [Kiritimatiellia bacterium]
MNFWQSSVVKVAAATLAAAVFAGCDSGTGLKELAESQAAYARRDLRAADKAVSKSLRCNPKNVDALLHATRVQLELGHIAEARKLVTRAAELEPEASDVLLTDAEAAYIAKDYATAMRDYRSVAEDGLQPPEIRAQALAGIGVVQMSVNEFDMARVALLKSLRLDRKNPAGWYHLGLLYRDGFGYHEAALEAFDIYVRLEPTADVRVQKVQRSYIPDIKETIARKAASRPGASQRDSEKSASLLQEAEALQSKAQYRSARKKFEEALAADPLSYKAALGLGGVIPKTDKTPAGAKKQLEVYTTACKLQPGSTATLLSTANLAARLGFHASALDLYSRALATDSANLTALDGLIKAIKKVGGKNDIAAAYQEYRGELASKRQ